MPRFTGRQYPGAMKDLRARKREEAEARQVHARNSEPHERDLGIFAEGAKAFAASLDSLAGAFRRLYLGQWITNAKEQTQDDFALAPAPVCGGAEPASLNLDNGGVLPGGVTRVTKIGGEPEYIYTREEWEYIHGLGKMPEAGQ